MQQPNAFRSLVVIALVLLIGSATAMAERRTALVIGNAAYRRDIGPLRTPVNDASDLATALQQLGFEVTLLRNADLRTMREAMETFSRSLRQDDVGLFYFSGHGVQVGGENYLIPLQANLRREQDVPDAAMPVGWVLGRMEEAGNNTNIVILDACRDNPFAPPGRAKSMQRGLVGVPATRGSLIAYATAPGAIAAEGEGRNGVYTSSLLKHLPTPGVPVEQLFKRVRAEVVAATRGKQTPWESSSLMDDFIFATQASGSSGPVSRPGPTPPLLNEQQAAALQLGFAEGSAVSRVALPIEARQLSAAGITYSRAELRLLLAQLPLSEQERTAYEQGVQSAQTERDPKTAAATLLAVVHQIKDIWERSKKTELVRLHRIGFVLGFVMEVAATTVSINPTEEHVKSFTDIAQRTQVNLTDDISRADLPGELREAIQRTTLPVQSVADLRKVVATSQEVLQLVKKSKTVTGSSQASLPSLPSEEAKQVKAKGAYYAGQIRCLPMLASVYTAELTSLAEQLWADPRYTTQMPQQTALIYRLYAATILLSPLDDKTEPISLARNALPWLRKALELDEHIKDYSELRAAEQFLTAMAGGKVASVDLQTKVRHDFRVAMPEAKAEEVEKQVQERVRILKIILEKSMAQEDLEALASRAVAQARKQCRTEVTEWSQHRHPHGFTFRYPTVWTVQDDAENKSTLLLPPGITLESPGPKAIFIVAAHYGFSDPLAMRSYFERQLAPTHLTSSYTQEPFTQGVGPGAILNWEDMVPASNTNSGFRAAIVIINNWAVHIDAFGPKAQTEIHDATMRSIATSFAWK